MGKCDGEEGMKKAGKGQFVVYVGEELRRFTLPLSYLKNPIFQQLLKKSAEEYGYSYSRGIVLPCDESTFRSFINSRLEI
uniref:Auxin-induced protein 6B n=1 Tax=Cajanus cajan TaxID=3821 RepID=A0A151TQZ5_CAJCA|nr:Auxin-induced protein 6B [Cajanus cajan]